jgi:hypothetical protein
MSDNTRAHRHSREHADQRYSRTSFAVGGAAAASAVAQFRPHGSDRTALIAQSGGARRDRTDDLLLAKQALSQLSYGPCREQISVISTPTLRTRRALITDH